MGSIYNTIFVNPITNILLFFYHFFLVIKLPGAFGFSIIALTVFIRLLLQPFFHKQMETAQKMQNLKPHLDNLSKKHGKDKAKMQAEQARLFQEHGVNPASGCLLIIIQIPVFIALYNTLFHLFSAGQVQVIRELNQRIYAPFLKVASIDPHFFGFNLAASPKSAHIWYYYLIPVVTGLLQYLLTTMTMPAPQKSALAKVEKGKEKPDDSGDFQKALNTQMKYVFPVLIGWFAYSMPVGLSLYWNIFSIFGILQQRALRAKTDSSLSLKGDK